MNQQMPSKRNNETRWCNSKKHWKTMQKKAQCQRMISIWNKREKIVESKIERKNGSNKRLGDTSPSLLINCEKHRSRPYRQSRNEEPETLNYKWTWKRDERNGTKFESQMTSYAIQCPRLDLSWSGRILDVDKCISVPTVSSLYRSRPHRSHFHFRLDFQ